MIDHLIFDFDGTISDSYPVFNRIIAQIAQTNEIEITADEAEIDRLLKIRTGLPYTTLGWDVYLTREEYSEQFLYWQNQFVSEFRPFEEALVLLKFAKQKGKKLYIYTHSGDVVKKIIQHFEIASLFEHILTADNNFPRKPAPDALLHLEKEFSLDPKRCMMIGDRPIDAQAGMNAGMKGCLWDAENKYPNEKVDYRVSSLLEICDLI